MMEFSKTLLALSWSVALALTTASIILPIWGVPIDGVTISLPLVYAEVAVANGFYFWKAKNENRNKYALKYVDYIAKQYDIETAIRIAEIVLKD